MVLSAPQMTRQEKFASAVTDMKRELARLQERLREADARGDSKAALELLSRMLHLQTAFLKAWPADRANAESSERDDGVPARREEQPGEEHSQAPSISTLPRRRPP